jgi:Holliday junction resolvasome RuvABC endonuclease subunit
MENKTKVLLALDQSTSATGWGLFVENELKDYGVIKQSGFEAERINRMRNWLGSKLFELKLNYPNTEIRIALEDIQLQGTDVSTYKILAHLQGVLIDEAYAHKTPVAIWSASSWKSFLSIKGKDRLTQKKNAHNYISERFKINIIQDTCDAICIGLYDIGQNESEINFD